MFFLLLSSSCYALIDLENACQIKRQDHLQQFIDYDCRMINATHYELVYSVSDEDAFFQLDNLTGDYGFLYKNKKEKDQALENMISDKKLKYDKDKIRENIKYLKSNYFPKKIYGKLSLSGEISPYLQKSGKVDIHLQDELSNIIGSYFEIGFGTLVVEFSNGESTELLNLTVSPGFLWANTTRYADLSKFGQFTSAIINITGSEGDYGVYDEYEYFDGAYESSKWNWSGYIEDEFGYTDAENNYGQSISRLLVETKVTFADDGDVSYQNLGMGGFDNLKVNGSILISYHVETGYCGGVDPLVNALARIQITDGSNIVNVESFSCDASVTRVRNYIINESNSSLQIYDESNNYVSYVNLSSLTGDTWYLNYYTYVVRGDFTGAYSRFYVYDIGYNDNETEYKSYAEATVYPNGTTFCVGDTLVFSNTSQFDYETQIDISSALGSAINGALCDCDRCVLSGSICYVPFDFYSNTGASILYENLSINYTELILNVTLYNETDAGDFVIGGHNITLYTYCENESRAYPITNQSTATFNSCVPDYFVLKVRYGDDEYYRTLSNFTDEKLDWYIPDITKDSVVETVLTIYDLTGEYSDGFIILEKYFGEDKEEIIVHPIGADYKVNLFMIQNYHYTLKIMDNNGNLRSYGYFYASSAGSKTIILPAINFADSSTLGDTVNFYWDRNAASIYLYYNDTLSQTLNLSLWIINLTSDSSYYAYSEANLGGLSATIPADNKTSYYACFNVTHSELGDLNDNCRYFLAVNDKTTDENTNRMRHWISVAILVIILLGATIYDASGVLSLFTIVSIFFIKSGWTNFGSAGDGILVSFGALFTVLSLFWESDKR